MHSEDWSSRSAALRPEILPPGTPDPTPHYEGNRQSQGYQQSYGPPPAAPPARQRGRWAFAPATYALLAINLLVFVPMAINPGINNLVLAAGANNGDLEVNGGQWWRVLTSMFIHYGYIHFLSNMWCLWNLGLLGEPLLGSDGLLATYLLTGAAGGLLSTAIHPDVLSVGASGAIFGLAGVLIVLLKSPLLPVPPQELNRLRRSVIWFAALNFVIGGGVWLAHAQLHTQIQIDNMAHLGGFLGGLALGVPLLPKIGSRPRQFARRQWLAYGAGAFLLLLIAYGIYRNRVGP